MFEAEVGAVGAVRKFYNRAAKELREAKKINSDALHCLERYLTEQDEQFIMDAIGILKGETND